LSARILMTGSLEWTDTQVASDALDAALILLGSVSAGSTLVHGAAKGADKLVAAAATRQGFATEAHPAEWSKHTAACPDWDLDRDNNGRVTCMLAGPRRNAEMVALGADLVLAFPTHGYALAPGETRKNTSRGTWDCAEAAKNAGLPVLVVWQNNLYPFGNVAVEFLAQAVDSAATVGKSITLGKDGQISIIEAWLPF